VVCGDAIAQKNAELSQLRESYSRSVEERIAQRVTFLEDDICASSIRPESVDVVVSWEVLEHVTKPGEAFANMARVLKPGGFAFHEYNPFSPSMVDIASARWIFHGARKIAGCGF